MALFVSLDSTVRSGEGGVECLARKRSLELQAPTESRTAFRSQPVHAGFRFPVSTQDCMACPCT